MNARQRFPLLLCSAAAFGTIAAGCGGGGGGSSVSAATFCSELNSAKAQVATLAASITSSSAPPSKAAIQSAATRLQKMADTAPSAVKGDMQTDADAFERWAKNGDDSELKGSTFNQADVKLLDWHNANCK